MSRGRDSNHDLVAGTPRGSVILPYYHTLRCTEHRPKWKQMKKLRRLIIHSRTTDVSHIEIYASINRQQQTLRFFVAFAKCVLSAKKSPNRDEFLVFRACWNTHIQTKSDASISCKIADSVIKVDSASLVRDKNDNTSTTAITQQLWRLWTKKMLTFSLLYLFRLVIMTDLNY